MSVYYNDNDPFCAAWLRELIKDGLIPDGEVDERGIEQVAPSDVSSFAQCHFFAGIGGWAYALRLAKWEGPVWTGSCPCQPFSVAGQRKGAADKRHLWPEMLRLIKERGPATIFGEQVASRLGREWLSGVRADLESIGYAVGAASLPAISVGAPHQRQRLWFVADTNSNGLQANTNESTVRPQAHNGGVRGRFSEVGSSGEWATPRPPGARPMAMANGLQRDVGRLRAYGNAIVPQVAAEFIGAYLEATS